MRLEDLLHGRPDLLAFLTLVEDIIPEFGKLIGGDILVVLRKS